MCQWFGPSTMKITFERDGPGAFTEEMIQNIIVKDESAEIVGLNVPKNLVRTANHQVRRCPGHRRANGRLVLHVPVIFTPIGGICGA